MDALNISLIDPEGLDWSTLGDPVAAVFMEYDDVVRDVIGSFDGIIGSLPSLNQGDVYSWSDNYTIPSTIEDEFARIVVLVLDRESGEILSAVQQQLEVPSSVAQTTSLDFELFPNPVADKLYIAYGGSESTMSVKVEVLDARGKRLIVNELYNISRGCVDLAGLSPGIYFVSLMTQSGSEIKKLIVK